MAHPGPFRETLAVRIVPPPAVPKARIRAIGRRLARAHGARRTAPRRLPPIDELVLTVLSQHTSDVNRDRAFDDLRRAFPTWAEVADAPVPAIARAIRRGGLAPTKAVRIRALLAELRAQGRSLDGRAFTGMRAGALFDLLVALPGVGPKTAACVLLFSLGKPYFPVDTHVHRIALRLGLVPPKTDAVRAQRALQAAIAPAEMYAVHMDLIRHGRTVCDARRPRCEECVLRDLCPRVGVAAARR